LEVEKTATTADMDASQNYWGTTNTTIIDSMIYDNNDDGSCSSFINYLPLLDAPEPETPIAPTPTPSPTPTATPIPTSTGTPEPTSAPTNTPDPSPSPNPLTSPTNTSTPTETTNSSSATDQTDNPTLTISDPTINPSEALNNADSSNGVAIPEFSPWGVVLILFAAGSLSIVTLKRKKLKLTEE
jgi:hypothetical protein